MPVANAEKFDVEQEIKISSSRQAADLKNKIFSYIDNVIISQGTLTIHAELVQVITQDKTDNKIYVAKGSPATFEQTLQDGSPIDLQANEIRYEVVNRTISLAGDAELQQDSSKVQGDKITFDMITEQLLATGGAGENGEGRVTTVFTPDTIRKTSSKKDNEGNE